MKYHLTYEASYPPLYDCFLPQSLPCPTKDSASRCLEILLSAKNHGVRELTVPKKSKNKTNSSKMYLNGRWWRRRWTWESCCSSSSTSSLGLWRAVRSHPTGFPSQGQAESRSELGSMSKWPTETWGDDYLTFTYNSHSKTFSRHILQTPCNNLMSSYTNKLGITK